MSGAQSERFWDERAKENAYYFVDSRVDYHDPDGDEFWRGGEDVVCRLEESLGLEFRGHETVLDIGCGVGRLTRALASRAARVIGLDVSSAMLAQARELNGDLDNVEWVHGDGQTLTGIADGSVDTCFSFVVFQHLPDADMTLGYVREMARVLKPGGRTAFQVSTDPDVHDRRPPLRRRLRAVVGRAPKGQADPAWLGSAVDPDRLRETASASGLEIERVDGLGTLFTVVLARRVSGRGGGGD